MWLNCKLIKKWHAYHLLLHQLAPFSGIPSFLAKIFDSTPTPQVIQFLEGPAPFNKGWGGRVAAYNTNFPLNIPQWFQNYTFCKHCAFIKDKKSSVEVFWVTFNFCLFWRSKVKFSVRKMRIEHTTNVSIWRTGIQKMLEVQYGFVWLYKKFILHKFIAVGTH